MDDFLRPRSAAPAFPSEPAAAAPSAERRQGELGCFDPSPAAPKPYTVAEFIARCNAALACDFEDVYVEGEVASLKISQGKWIFFDLKEGESSVNCFMVPAWMTAPIVDGMKVRVRATPKLTRWGKFSLTAHQAVPIGEGNIKKSFELLKRKLAAEGLFDPARKRPLPHPITRIGVISSTGAAGYHDFLKILNNRWCGLQIETVNTQVQGMAAPQQIIRALNYLNEHSEADVIAIVRGGGSADDLAAFNDEALARAIAASRIPVITGIGHEVDESLADLVADVRASTPSNAAERLTPDKNQLLRLSSQHLTTIRRALLERIQQQERQTAAALQNIRSEFLRQIRSAVDHVDSATRTLSSLNPEDVLRRGYAIVTRAAADATASAAARTRDDADSHARARAPAVYTVGEQIAITTASQILTAEIQNVQNRTSQTN